MGKHNWGNYFLAAYKGVFEHLAAKGQQLPAPVGLQVVVHGRVPTGGSHVSYCLSGGVCESDGGGWRVCIASSLTGCLMCHIFVAR